MKPEKKKEPKVLSQEEYERKIAELQQELEELKKVKVEDKKTIWEPEVGDDYFYINEIGLSIKDWHIRNDELDFNRFMFGNFYKTNNEAVYQAKVQKYTSLFRKYIKEHSEPLDWADIGTSKWLIKWSFYDNDIIFDCSSKVKSQGVVYASSKEILDDAIKFVGKNNVIKYVLEVEED